MSRGLSRGASTEHRGAAALFAGGFMIVCLHEKLTWLPCGARGGTAESTGSSAVGSL